MALFEVPGWTVPSVPMSNPASQSKKRKRPTPRTDEDKLQSAEVNLDKLVAKLRAGGSASAADEAPRKRKRKEKARSGDGQSVGNSFGKDDRLAKGEKKIGDAVRRKEKSSFRGKAAGPTTEERLSAKQKKNNKNQTDRNQRADDGQNEASISAGPSKPKEAADSIRGLTAMQASMKQSLDGARFRWINEMLYKSDSEHAHSMMRENPAVFSEYHTGFRHQVQSWPVNPVSHYISALSSCPPKTVIADLGCGDATLAHALVPKGFTVLSYDLVSADPFVVEADICSKLPLPGSEGDATEDGEARGQVVDIVVFALSLMGTNWPKSIREAWRILRPGGELKIAEVASRFSDVEEFTSLISAIGFRLRSTDDRNSHFTLFEFTKINRKKMNEKEWSKLLARGEVLKPCEYKRR